MKNGISPAGADLQSAPYKHGICNPAINTARVGDLKHLIGFASKA